MGKTLADLEVGSKVKFGKYQVESEEPWDIVWTIVAKNHSCEPAYPENSVTLHATEILDLRCFDAKEPNNSNSDRVNYGNNRYAVSNMTNWLNSKAAAGSWYSAQHSADQSPNSSSYVYAGTQHASRPGFLNLFSDNEYNAILDTTIRTAKSTTDGAGYEDITVKVFLPSKMEVGLGRENSISEGAAWEYYTSNSARIGYLTQQCYDNTVSTSKPSSKSTAWYWWLRTPCYSFAYSARYVDSDGSLGNYYAYYGDYGVRPALNLSNTIKVSDTTDSDGAYSLLSNSAPTISGTDGDIGVKNKAFTYTYSVSDDDGNIVTVTEAIDGATIKTHYPVLDRENTLSVDGTTWSDLDGGSHTITITATDASGDTAVRTLTFTKIAKKTYESLGAWVKDACDAIREKGGYTESIPHGEIPERIRAIPQEIVGEDTGDSTAPDLSGLDAVPADVRTGKTFIDSAGEKETGSMKVYTSSSVTTATSNGTALIPAGYHDGTSSIYVSVPTSSTTYGSMGSTSIFVDSSTGKITATPYVSSSGYISSGYQSATTKDQTTQEAQTITPGTANKTISSGVFLTGTQTIKGDSNLVASNIKSGVSIFNVTGTYGGSSGNYECEYITWDGNNYELYFTTSKKAESVHFISVHSNGKVPDNNYLVAFDGLFDGSSNPSSASATIYYGDELGYGTISSSYASVSISGYKITLMVKRSSSEYLMVNSVNYSIFIVYTPKTGD